MGRLRAAWNVLRGEITTPAQIWGQWLDYQIIFDSILEKLNTALARMAKAQKRQLERNMKALQAMQEPTHRPVAATPKDRKRELRRRVVGASPVPTNEAPHE